MSVLSATLLAELADLQKQPGKLIAQPDILFHVSWLEENRYSAELYDEADVVTSSSEVSIIAKLP